MVKGGPFRSLSQSKPTPTPNPNPGTDVRKKRKAMCDVLMSFAPRCRHFTRHRVLHGFPSHPLLSGSTRRAFFTVHSPCLYHRTPCPLRPANVISRVKQEPLFPGSYRDVTRYEGEHVYNYTRHTFNYIRDTVPLAIIPVGCLIGHFLFRTPSDWEEEEKEKKEDRTSKRTLSSSSSTKANPMTTTTPTAGSSTSTSFTAPLPSDEAGWVWQVAFFCVVCGVARLNAAGRRNRIVKDLTGRHVLVTGATSGVGLATAAQLARMGADVTMVARKSDHADRAVAYVQSYCKHRPPSSKSVNESGNEETKTGEKRSTMTAAPPLPGRENDSGATTATEAYSGQRIRLLSLDLADLIAVRDFCKRLRQGKTPIDLLVNNAGVLQEKHVTTRFGDDVQLVINYLGPYLLTEGLLPLVEAAQGRVVYVSCAAHVGVRGNIVHTYLTGRGVWSPRVADKFDGLEQYGFTKLGNIYHAQDLAVRSYRDPPKQTVVARLTAQKDAKLKPATPQMTAAEHAMSHHEAPRYTTCACNPGGVVTNLYRDIPLGHVVHYLYYVFLLVMRTPWEGSQVVVNCCVRDELRNGGYYANGAYRPSALSRAACDVKEREGVMAWTRKKMQPYMKWD